MCHRARDFPPVAQCVVPKVSIPRSRQKYRPHRTIDFTADFANFAFGIAKAKKELLKPRPLTKQ
jgi:hypothetical protein